MKKTTSNYFRSLALAAALMGVAVSAQASLIEIKFNTAAITGIASADPFKLALDRAGISVSPAPTIGGRFYYESTTADSNNANIAVGIYNGALDSLSFSVGSWFSQSLTSIALNGDITVRNDTGTGNNVIDQIVVEVTGTGAQNAGLLGYSFLDPGLLAGTSDDVTWVLDRFLMTLTHNPPLAAPSPWLSSDSLPTRAQWEEPLSTFTTKSIALRFNPTGSAGNESVAGVITFLAVPEPGTLVLLGLGLLGLAGMRRKA